MKERFYKKPKNNLYFIIDFLICYIIIIIIINLMQNAETSVVTSLLIKREAIITIKDFIKKTQK